MLPQNLEQLRDAAAFWAERGKMIEAQTLDTISVLLPEQVHMMMMPEEHLLFCSTSP